MIDIRKANGDDAALINELAHQIWYPTYSDILSKEQIDFMLENLYAKEAIRQSMKNGSTFYLVYLETASVGFISLQERDLLLRIDKLYLSPETQGRGLGKALIEFASEIAKEKGLNCLELNVNRGNKAYNFYLRQGFKVVETVDIPYYQFVLNDYVMQKSLIS